MTKWEKFKKFVKDHEETIVVEGTKIGYYALGLVVGTVLTTYTANKRITGMEVCCGGMREGSNDTIFDIYLRNNKVVSFDRPLDESWHSQPLHLS